MVAHQSATRAYLIRIYNMSDIYLDIDTHDLDFDGVDLRLTEDTESIAQRLKITLLAYKGEWFLNTQFGTPYHQEILVKSNLDTVPTTLQQVIRSVPGVQELTEFTSTLNKETRKLDVSFKVVASTSEEIEFNISI